MKNRQHRNNGGFTIFFAMLVGGLALAIGVAIYDLTVRELDLSGTATQSQYAIYAADTGAECALYWDFKCELSGCSAGAAFATSSESVVPTTGVSCNGIDVAGGAAPWNIAATPSAATTTFTLTFLPQTYCATVEVAKRGSPSVTTVISHGFNSCNSPATVRLERVLQVTY